MKKAKVKLQKKYKTKSFPLNELFHAQPYKFTCIFVHI